MSGHLHCNEPILTAPQPLIGQAQRTNRWGKHVHRTRLDGPPPGRMDILNVLAHRIKRLTLPCALELHLAGGQYTEIVGGMTLLGTALRCRILGQTFSSILA